MSDHHQHWAIIHLTAAACWLRVVRNVRTPEQAVIVTVDSIHRPRTLKPRLSTGIVVVNINNSYEEMQFTTAINMFQINRLHCAYEAVTANYIFWQPLNQR